MHEQGLAVARRYVEIGQPERALETLADLDSESAASIEARHLRGFALLAAERFADAAAVARDALEDDPGSPELLFLLALALEHMGELGEAEAAVLAALAEQPDDPQLLCQYASICMRGGQLDKAERLLQAAEAIEPGSGDVLSERISLAYLRGDDRGARRLTEELLALDPEDVQAHRMLGTLDAKSGHMAAAARRYAEAVRQDPTHEPTAGAARSTRRFSRWWWAPFVAVSRLGVAGSWLAAMAIIFGLRGLGYPTAAAVATALWLVFCVISWVVPRDD